LGLAHWGQPEWAGFQRRWLDRGRGQRLRSLLQRHTCVNHWPACWSGEGVKYLLHIIVLFELVDHGQNLRRLFFRQLGRNGADVLVLG
jgi:hypothetical protein